MGLLALFGAPRDRSAVARGYRPSPASSRRSYAGDAVGSSLVPCLDGSMMLEVGHRSPAGAQPLSQTAATRELRGDAISGTPSTRECVDEGAKATRPGGDRLRTSGADASDPDQGDNPV